MSVYFPPSLPDGPHPFKVHLKISSFSNENRLLKSVLDLIMRKSDLDPTLVPTLANFARKHSVRQAVLTDSCGEQIVVIGRPPKPRPEDCSHIFEHGNGKLGLCLLYHSARAWHNARDRCVASGMILSQDGDTEGLLIFDPTNPAQANLAKKESRARKEKVAASPEEKTRRIARGHKLAAAKQRTLRNNIKK